MADDLLLMRRKQKDKWRQREEDRRKTRLQLDKLSSGDDDNDGQTTNVHTPTRDETSTIKRYDKKETAVDLSCENQINIKERNISFPFGTLREHDLTDNKPSVVEVLFPQLKKSPSSSISESQSQSPDIEHKKRFVALSKKSDLSSTIIERNMKTILQPRIIKNSGGDSSSSDDDENHLEFFRKRQQQLNNKTNEKDRQPDSQPKLQSQLDTNVGSGSTNIMANGSGHINNTSKTSLETSTSYPTNESKIHPLSISSVTQRVCDSNDSDDSSASDEDLLQGFKQHLKSKGLFVSNRKEIPADEDNSVRSVPQELTASRCNENNLISSNDDHRNLTQTTTEKPSPARNPLAKMKEMDRSFKELEASHIFSINEREGKNLWSDSDTSLPKSEEKITKKRKMSDKKSDTNIDKNTGRRKQKRSNLETCQDDDELNENLIENEVKPTFFKPKFGPYEFIPLVLTVESGNDNDGSTISDQYEVPASINRYLKEYQQEGIRFVFQKAIANRIGAILGDDIGLGKTVQIVSLLAALLEKTGTGKDAIELKKRKRLAQQRLTQQQANREEALMQGRFVGQAESTVADFPLPKWCPVLIVIPKSVAEGWMTTFSEWGHFSVTLYDGPNRSEAIHSVIHGISEIMICSMAMLSRKEDFKLISSCKWKLVVVDEFHQFKNERGHLSTNLRSLKQQRQCVVIGLTGTVMQNDHKELWNLVDLAAKDFLGSWSQFEAQYAKPIKLARAKDANIHAIELGRIKGQELSSKLREIYIQRKKEDVLADELPEKDEQIVFCEPSQLQKDLYEYILQLPDFVLMRESTGPCDCGVNQKFFLELQNLRTKERKIAYLRKNRNKILTRGKCCYTIPRVDGSTGDIDPNAILWRQMHKDNNACESCPTCIFLPALDILTKLSSHASLLQLETPPENLPIGSVVREKAEEALERAKILVPEHLIKRFPGQSYIRHNRITDDHFTLSGKMKVVDRLLRNIKSQQGRLLFFSQSTKVLDLVQNYVVAEGYSFLRMDGSTSRKKRDECVESFKKNDDAFIFLLSTRAMGIGLNLTAANFVIIFDVEWNPSNDAQAQDRVYRIGQERNVTVFRLVCRGTVEEQKYMRQVYKKQLKSETIMEDVEVDRNTAVRFFRGVAGDKYRKGELFGFVNLIKFDSRGTFLNYAEKGAGSSRYGEGVIKNSNVLEVIKERHESLEEDDTFDLLEGLARTHKDIATRTTEDSDPLGKDDFEESALGGESQVMLDIFDRAKTIFPDASSISNDDDKCTEAGEATTAIVEQNEGTTLAKATKLSLESPNVRERNAVASAQKSCILVNNVVEHKPRDETGRRRPSSVPRPVVSRNVSLVGQTTNKIKHGAAKTSFSLNDLHLPTGVRRKKPP